MCSCTPNRARKVVFVTSLRVTKHTGMKVTGADPDGAIHRRQGSVREQNGTREAVGALEERSRELEQLDLRNHLVDATTPLFADSEPAHQRSERLVPRPRWAVHEAHRVHEGLTRTRDVDAVVEDLDHRSRARHREVLVDQRVGDQLPNGEFGEHRDATSNASNSSRRSWSRSPTCAA